MIVAFKVAEFEVILVAGPVVAMGSDDELELDELLDKLELELELDELLELKLEEEELEDELEEVEVDELLELEIGKGPSGAIFTL
mgnify:FL=1